jgi:hypothetical protein
MPLTEKGARIKSAMEKQYGKEKGEKVFYASKNKGKISGVDSDEKADDNQHMGFTKGQASDIEKIVNMCDSVSTRLDAFEKRRAMQKTPKVEPRNKDNMQPSNRHPKEPAKVRVTSG